MGDKYKLPKSLRRGKRVSGKKSMSYGIWLVVVGTLVMSSQGAHKVRGKRSKTATGHYPFMVEIRIYVGSEAEVEASFAFDPAGVHESKSRTCSGTIIYPTLVLTSCSCVSTGRGDYYDVWRYSVLAGTRNVADFEPRFQGRRVERVYPHPSCQIIPNDINQNDVAILILDRRLEYGADVDQVTVAWDLSELEWVMAGKDSLLLPEDFDEEDFDDPIEETAKAEQCVVLGFEKGPAKPWGVPKTLLMDRYKIIDGGECNEKFCAISKNDPFCTRKFWCLGEMCAIRNDTSNDCNLDTGGPIVCNNKVYGVDAYRPDGCKNDRAPHRFPNLRAIQETMIQLCNSDSARGLASTTFLEPLPDHRAHNFVVEIDIREAASSNPRETFEVAHHRCTGTVFSPKMVMTACHCVAHYEFGKPLTFYEGWQVEVLSASRKRWDQVTPTIKVHTVVPHPSCSRGHGQAFFQNDVAMLLLEEPLQLGSEVNKIPLGLPPPLRLMERLIDINEKCFVAGLGMRGSRKGTPSIQLLEGTVLLEEEKTCKEKLCKEKLAYSPKEGFCNASAFADSGYVCAKREVPQDCFGHTGGPLVCRGEVYGIDSVGLDCRQSLPSVFTRLSIIDQVYSIVENDPRLKELAALPSCRDCPY